MLKQLRLLFIGLFFGLFVIACGGETDDAAPATDDSASNDAAVVADNESEDSADNTTESESGITSGMTEKEVIKKLGEPDIKETYSIDTLEVGQYEWHSDEGITSVQLHNGEVTYSRFIPADGN